MYRPHPSPIWWTLSIGEGLLTRAEMTWRQLYHHTSPQITNLGNSSTLHSLQASLQVGAWPFQVPQLVLQLRWFLYLSGCWFHLRVFVGELAWIFFATWLIWESSLQLNSIPLGGSLKFYNLFWQGGACQIWSILGTSRRYFELFASCLKFPDRMECFNLGGNCFKTNIKIKIRNKHNISLFSLSPIKWRPMIQMVHLRT